MTSATHTAQQAAKRRPRVLHARLRAVVRPRQNYDRIYVVNEIYARGLNPMALAQTTLSVDRQYGAHRQMQGIIDSASFADIGMGGGRANIMNTMGCRWQPSEKGQGSRIAGKSHIHERLAMKSDGAPGLQIFSNCKNLIRTLRAVPYSPTNPEDIDANSEEHAVDAGCPSI